MINFNEFSPVDENIKYYHFENLMPLKDSNPSNEIYRNLNGEIIKIVKLSSIKQVYILHELWERDIYVNIRGFNRKGTQLYAFCVDSKHLTLQQIVDKQLKNSLKKVFDEQFCTDLINSIVFALKNIQSFNVQLGFLTPKDIICVNFNKNLLETQSKSLKKSNSLKFSLNFPTTCNMFSPCTEEQLRLNQQFIAPQHLRNIIQPKKSPFRKAILYSIGLVMLYIFGYSIEQSFKLESLHNPRNLIKYIKGIRKQIKILHNGGKYIAKLLKLLLENSEALRDSLDIFIYKMLSPQMQSLRKIVDKQSLNSFQTIKCETIVSDEYNNHIYGTHCTIDIKGSKNSLQKTHKQLEQLLKSNKSMKSLSEVKQQQQNSPITIQLDELSDFFDKNKSVKPNQILSRSQSIKYEQKKENSQKIKQEEQIKEQSKQIIQESDQRSQSNQSDFKKKINIIVSAPKEQKPQNDNENIIVNWNGREEDNECHENKIQLQLQKQMNNHNFIESKNIEGIVQPLNQQNILKNGFKDRSNLTMFVICVILLVYGVIDFIFDSQL